MGLISMYSQRWEIHVQVVEVNVESRVEKVRNYDH